VLAESFMLHGLADQIERYMDLLSARQRLVASNIANADTPGYKTRDLDFATEFQSATDTAHPEIREVEGLKTKNDGNNVSIDRESRLLAENAIRFSLASQMLRSEIRSLKNAIEEGKNA
jgi:flagellar basal-body rod protein FlgB